MAKKANGVTGVRFVGDGLAYLPGVPLRDMSAEEWNALPIELRLAATASELYEASNDIVVVEAAPQQATEVTP